MKIKSMVIRFVVTLSLVGSLAGFADPPKVNFIFVVENTSLITAQRTAIKNSFAQFLTNLGPIQYRMGVVSGDFFTSQGALLQTPNGVSVITNASSDPAGDFGRMIDGIQDTSTAFWQQGLVSAKTVIDQHPADFLQDNVPLILVFISQDDDWSCKDHCYGVEPMNNPSFVAHPVIEYVDFFRGLKRSRNIEVSVFPLVSYVSTACPNWHRGVKYLELQSSIGYGVRGSICKDQIQADFLNIATVVAGHK